MISDGLVLALVPARSGSKGLPGKNIRPLAGRPLLAWPVAAGRQSRYVDDVVVSTDSEQYAAIARAAGADVPFLRPAELASDQAPSIGFILHALEMLERAGRHYKYLILLEPTSPLTEATDVDAALEELDSSRDVADAIVSVAELSTAHPAFAVRRLGSGLVTPYAVTDFGSMPRRQDVEPLFALDGSFYLSDVAALRRERSFYHSRTLGRVSERHKSLEIDDLVDFFCVEAVLAHRAEVEASIERDRAPTPESRSGSC